MNINKNELKTIKTYVTYDEGYRIVYYYDNHHEVPEGLYAKTIEDFIKFLKKDNNDIVSTSIDNILNEFLKLNPKALGVAIYDVNQNCILKKTKENIKTINNSTVYKEELIYDYNDKILDEGYRIVYFKNDNEYIIGTYCQNIEGFMIDFANEPIMDDDDIPEFISIDDLLTRYLNMMSDIKSVAIYNIDGTCITKKNKNNSIKK